MTESGPSKKYKVAVVGGAGAWGRRYLSAYADRSDCDITVVDLHRTRRHEFAEHFGIQTECDTVEDLLGQQVPDIVSIILPVAFSADAVIACAEAGVRVVSCEKPITAELRRADDMLRICRERGTALACGTGHWEIPSLIECAAWVREGNIGLLTAAAIPGGLPCEMSGGGCVRLVQLLLVTGMEAEWVEGWTLPSLSRYGWPDDVPEDDRDCPGYGRLGLSGGIVCEVLEPQRRFPCHLSVTGDGGRVWFNDSGPVLVQGSGPAAIPVHPDFLRKSDPVPLRFEFAIERLIRAFDTGEDVVCSGDDYRKALEITIALKLSAQQGHKRIMLPLADRDARIVPIPYRLIGGDAAGWESVGYRGPPGIPRSVTR